MLSLPMFENPPRDTAMDGCPVRKDLPGMPYEIMVAILEDLSLEDIFDLLSCCKELAAYLQETSFCKHFVVVRIRCPNCQSPASDWLADYGQQRKAPYSLEAQDAQQEDNYPRAFRRIVKRRRALAEASPYVVATVAFGKSFSYSQGILCYDSLQGSDRCIRLLDLRSPAKHELVVDASSMLHAALSRGPVKSHIGDSSEGSIESDIERNSYNLEILHYACGIISVLLTWRKRSARPRCLLIIRPADNKVFEPIHLDCDENIFVRNNEQYLYYGVFHAGEDLGEHKWELRCFSLQLNRPLDQAIELYDIPKGDVDVNVCFQIIDGWFYGVSSGVSWEIESHNWTSYYYCFRFELGHQFGPAHTEIMNRSDSWRRGHEDSTIEDRWSFIKLEKSEESGHIQIVEARAECQADTSRFRRTYYMQPLGGFRPYGPREDTEFAPLRYEGSHHLLEIDDTDTRERQLLKWAPAEPRPASQYHRGDDLSAFGMERQRVHKSAYQTCGGGSGTFFDLVSDPSPTEGCAGLRLRAGSRRCKPKLGPALSSSLGGVDGGDGNDAHAAQADESYRPGDIHFWPPERVSPGHKAHFDQVLELMSPGKVERARLRAFCDERSIVYEAGMDATGKLRALVYLSFDPSNNLAGALHAKIVPDLPEAGSGRHCEQGQASVPRARALARHDNTENLLTRSLARIFPPLISELQKPSDDRWARVASAMHTVWGLPKILYARRTLSVV